MMKKNRFLLSYQCYPLWVYNEKGELIGDKLPIELTYDEDIKKLLDYIHEIYDSLFENNEFIFEYKGFKTEKEKETFLNKINEVTNLIKSKIGDKYIIENHIDGSMI
jgi:hypothetical protein